jgi:hypothetical protein
MFDGIHKGRESVYRLTHGRTSSVESIGCIHNLEASCS